jgi:hypothetical protein
VPGRKPCNVVARNEIERSIPLFNESAVGIEPVGDAVAVDTELTATRTE